MMNALILVLAALLILTGLWLIIGFIRHLLRGRLLRCSISGTGSVICLLAGILCLSFALNLITYRQLTLERPVATLHFYQMAPQHFSLLIRTSDGVARQMELEGDEWQLDIRLLKWNYPLLASGFNSRYQLDRLSSRYRDLQQANSTAPDVFDLSESLSLDLWSQARKTGFLSRFIDAYYGNATFMPMADNARYEVMVGQQGLITRPANKAAEMALKNW